MVTCLVCHGPHNSLVHVDVSRDAQHSNLVRDERRPLPGRNPEASSFLPADADASYVHRISSNDE